MRAKPGGVTSAQGTAISLRDREMEIRRNEVSLRQPSKESDTEEETEKEGRQRKRRCSRTEAQDSNSFTLQGLEQL